MNLRDILRMPWKAFLAMLVTLVAPAVFVREATASDPEEARRVLRDAYLEIWSI